MKFLLKLFILLIYHNAFSQQPIIRGDSEPIRLTIGSAQSSSVTSLKVGQKIQGTSEIVRLTVGLEEIKTVGSNSEAIPLKLGTSIQKSESRKIETIKSVVEKEAEISGVPTYYTLIIGINNYQYASSNLPNLNKPVGDATLLKDVLLSKYTFAPTNTILLQNPTRTEILNVFEVLSKKITPKDNLLIFYAGHGYWDERLKVGYWLPSDSKTDDKSGWIPNSTIRDYIAGIDSKHTLLVSDACFSGSIFKTREVNSEINAYGVAKIYQLPSRKAMTSGTLTTVPDDSKFMFYMVKRLTENSSKYLTTRQLFSSLETAVLNNTNTVPQLGVIQETGDEGGDFIFIKRD